MKTLMDEYIDFTSKKIKKYIKIMLRSKYEDEIVEEFLKTYINSRYYNILEESSRPFYLKIIDSLNRKQEILKQKYGEEKAQIIEGTKELFPYMLFFDNVRKIENFKTIKSIKEVVSQLVEYVEFELGIKMPEKAKQDLYDEIISDMLDKDIYLDNFETDNFFLKFDKDKNDDTVYYTEVGCNIRLPMQYSQEAVEKVYNMGIVAENKLVIEYILLSVVVIRDILNGNFKDKYIAEFAPSLFKKAQKLDSILASLANQALQDKIYINVTYRDFQKNKKIIMKYTNKGYKFVIELDDYLKDIDEIKKLKVFNFVLLPKNIKLYKEIMKNKKQYTNLLVK